MIRILLAMFHSPEAQRAPYCWASAMVGHCWIGVGIWGGLAILLDRWTAVWLAPLLYLIVWEGGQIIATRKRSWRMVWDGLLDASAVALGCIAAAHLRDGSMLIAMWAWAGSFVVATIGWKVRDRA